MQTVQRLTRCLLTFALFTAASAFADTTVQMTLLSDDHTAAKAVGTVVISETPYGLLFTPHLTDVPPGAHGFHIHEVPSCDNNGQAAGPHFDPDKTGKHLGPYNDHGHAGDLPVLFVTDEGTATTPLLAPRLHKVSEIKQRALMIHHHGDNYADQPEKLGGGGARMVCGLIH